jgi:predicted Zn-dependent protease
MHQSIRKVYSQSKRLAFERGVFLPIEITRDAGAMIAVMLGGGGRPSGLGYCASADLSDQAIKQASELALQRAHAHRGYTVFEGVAWPTPQKKGVFYRGPRLVAADTTQLIDLLAEQSRLMQAAPHVVNSVASVQIIEEHQQFYFDHELVSDQQFFYLIPSLEVTVSVNGVTQTRSLAGQYNGFCQQGGAEVIAASGFEGAGPRLADEAHQLCVAPACPTGISTLVLAPDQMMLQIHESIGHPLELDRILGDERNFAGTSFVRPDMFGSYQYGSDLLNVSFDPGAANQLATYQTDDEGQLADKVMLIEQGLLKRPLGGQLSMARLAATGVVLEDGKGVANARSVGWHRAPIDRMANINVDPGATSLQDMIAAVEDGVLMRTNRSWSIDDSRNKFQFGCEWGQLIKDGQLGPVVRDPGYRGISANFWRNLIAVGDAASSQVMGTPFCGKGEPGQVIRVGHASPACCFADVEVFGAA